MPKTRATQEVFGAVTWNLIGMLCSLVNGVVTARILDPDDRGLLALALTISSLSYLVSSVGTNSAVRTLQPHHVWASFKTYLVVSAYLLIINTVVVMVAVLAFVQLGFVRFTDYVLVIAILGVLTFTSNQLLDMFNAAGRASSSAMANTIGHFSTMVSLLLLSYFFPGWSTLLGVLGCYAFSYACRAGAMLVMARRHSFSYGKASRATSKRFLRTSTKFWGINLTQTLTFRSEQFLLGVFSTAYSVGIYAVAATPASLMQVVSNSIGQVAYREAAIGSITPRRLMRFILAGFSLSFVYAVAMWVTAPYLMPLVFGDSYSETIPVVRILVFSGLLLSPYSILVRVLAGLNSPWVSSLSGVIGVAVLVPSMFLLAPEHGAVGAALGTVVAYASMLIVAVVGVSVRLRRAAPLE